MSWGGQSVPGFASLASCAAPRRRAGWQRRGRVEHGAVVRMVAHRRLPVAADGIRREAADGAALSKNLRRSAEGEGAEAASMKGVIPSVSLALMRDER